MRTTKHHTIQDEIYEIMPLENLCSSKTRCFVANNDQPVTQQLTDNSLKSNSVSH